MEQYIKFVEKLHYVKRLGRKAFVQSLFPRSKLAFQSNGFVVLSPIFFFRPIMKKVVFLIKEDNMYTIIKQ